MLFLGKACYARVDLTHLSQSTFERLREELRECGNAHYAGPVQDRFDHLLLLLIRFTQVRFDALGARFPYLRRPPEGASLPGEGRLQEDMVEFLSAQGNVIPEKSGVAAGRADIYLPQPLRPGFRFVIEVKRMLGTWTDEALVPLLNQTVAYQQQDVRIGVLAVLDLSDRPSGVPHWEACFEVRERIVADQDRRHAVMIRVPGNRRTPSDQPPAVGT